MLNAGVAACCHDRQGAKTPVELFQKGCGGALKVGCTNHGGGSGALGIYGGGRISEHFTSPRRHSSFAFERLVEGEEEFMPRLQCLLGGEITVPLGPIFGKVFGLEEEECGKDISQEGETGTHRLLLGVLERVDVLWEVGVLIP